MMKKSMASFALSSVLVAGLVAGCSSGQKAEPAANSGDSSKKISIKLAHTGSETHQYNIGAEAFKKALEEKSKGTMEVKIYANAKLGSEKDAVEGIQNGTVDMTVVSADSSMANVVPEMNVFGIPFLFKNKEHVYSVLDGEIGKSLLKKADEKNMKGLGFWEVGFRHMTTKNKEILKPEDVKGLKMRVQPAPVWQEFMKSLGANPTPVNFNELYSALEQGVVDGQENPIATIMSMKFYEVQKQLALTSHTYSPAVVLASNKFYKSLTDQQKKWLDEAVQEATVSQRKTLADAETKSLDELKSKGVNITQPDREAFAAATKDVAKSVADKVPQDLLDKIKAAAK
ncbi:TRAP transporter substrate-binding protein [Effusibacillus dendaii]|uniref:ABC transporter substrate-binding protein n=1 Tax=Effusibacillus dendaii TaxID=2743772 RepID=A0A7I8DC62_9BACL|nr:TRAP transporter substrate-binding protein [Effusibacillus dendaii]BCJ86922.1 ABC transporter substrate-binding protein [Effusibacillus dendaii]